MALVFADRVKDSSTTTGTGTFTISGTAATGYQTFSSGIGVGNTCYYCIAGQAGSTDPTEWEVGLGTLASATTITRSSGNVLSSSSGAGTLVNFSAGAKDVFVTSPALWATSPAFTGNVSTAQLSVGTTDTTVGYLNVSPTQSAVQYQFVVSGTNNYTGATVNGALINPNIVGTSSLTQGYGLTVNPGFTGVTGTVTGIIGTQSNPNWNSAGSVTNFSGVISNLALGASATGGTITNAYSNRAQAPTINASATTNITNFYQYYAVAVSNGTLQTITNAYSFYGLQTTSSGPTNNWNLYMSGNAPNYLAGALNVGSTTLTNAPVYFALSTSLQYNFMMQGTNTYSTASGTPIGMYINPNINGIASSVSMVGLSVVPIFGPVTSAVVSSLYGIIGNSYLNTANAPVTVTLAGIRGLFTLASAVSTRAVANGYAFLADTPSISSTSTITTAVGFFATDITKGSGTITNAYGFYGNQNTGSASNSWNLYMAGAAPNYLSSQLAIGTTTLTNGFLTVTATQSNSAYSIYVSGTNSNASTTIGGLYNSGSFTGASATTVYGINNQPTYNANAATSIYAMNTQLNIGAAALGGSTIGNVYGYYSQLLISGSVTSTITNTFQFYGANVNKASGQTITNSYAFYSNQGVGQATNSWQLYMSGAAPNYLAGQLLIGTTTLTSGFLTVNASQSNSLYQLYLSGTNTNTGATIAALYNDTTLGGGASTTTVYGIFNRVNTNTPSSNSITSEYGVYSVLVLGPGALGGSTIGAFYNFTAAPPIYNGSATTTITNAVQYYADVINKGPSQTVTNAYSFYANQSTGSATNSWCFYAAGNAPNYLNSNLLIGTTTVPSTASNIVLAGLIATSAAAPTVASGTTIAVTKPITFISGTAAIATITAPNPISAGGGQITLIPTGAFTTTTAGNIALASTAVVSKALIMTYDTTTAKWYPSY